MSPRCQSPNPLGYPDASLSAPKPSGAGGRKLGAGRAHGAPAGSSGNASPLPPPCLGAPLGCSAENSSAGPGHTRNRCRPCSGSDRSDIVDSPVAPPCRAGGLDSGNATSHTGRAGGRKPQGHLAGDGVFARADVPRVLSPRNSLSDRRNFTRPPARPRATKMLLGTRRSLARP